MPSAVAHREVWGLTITTNPAGKNIWPNDLNERRCGG